MKEFDIFTDALNRPDLAGRAAYLDEVCGATGPLRDRIERMLAMHESDQELLDRRPAEWFAGLREQTVRDDNALDTETLARLLAAFLAPPTRPGALGRLEDYVEL